MNKTRKYPELNALKGKIREEGETYRSISRMTGMSLNSVNSKLNGYAPLMCNEAELIAEVLNIYPSDIGRYFFPNLLQNATNGAR